MVRRLGLAAALLVVASLPSVGARRPKPSPGEDLVRLALPKSDDRAHPFVNVVVYFGKAKNGTAADPGSFRAKLNGRSITSSFRPIMAGGAITGMRAKVEPPLLKVGRRANRLALRVRSEGRGPRAVKDADKFKFRATAVENTPPEVHLGTQYDLAIPSVPMQFDGSQSVDPDGDELTYSWDFGDGETAAEPSPVHTYGVRTDDVVVKLAVSDGQDAAEATKTLPPSLPCTDGRTPGLLRVEADAALEFGPVAVGATAQRTLTIRNVSDVAGSEVKIALRSDDAAFQLDATDHTLGPNESIPVTLTFAPTAAGHQGARVRAIACASNGSTVSVLAHGFGGSAPGTGPTLASTPVFYSAAGIAGILPDGTRFEPDTILRSCYNGTSTNFGLCTEDADCPLGGTCPTTATCLGGERSGQPCTQVGDCPQGFCPASNPFLDALGFCGDGNGSLYVLSDEGAYEDPTPGEEEELSQVVVRLQLDGAGRTVDKAVLAPIYAETAQIACDGNTTGRVYVAEHRGFLNGQCFRDAREDLVSVRKTTGTKDVLKTRIDSAEGLDDCNDDIDETQNLEVTRDGRSAYASLTDSDDAAGIYRIWSAPGIGPTPLRVLQSLASLRIETFHVHPDGAVMVATAFDIGTTGVIEVYKVFPEQATSGALKLEDLTPCGTYAVPNNRGATFVFDSFAVDATQPGGLDGVILVSFGTSVPSAAQGAPTPLATPLSVRGTLAFATPAGSAPCTPLGLINLEFLDTLTF